MRRLFILSIICFIAIVTKAQENKMATPTIYIDSDGAMRWSDTQKEASFFGVNYTVPFAHAYRALGYIGANRKAAIDNDVYHLSRLGVNAYRIHLWDVELTDGEGNLIENDHLDLLDYLIAKLKERNIHIVITAQTDFGNGYPERNQPTGGFSYKYDKCSVHSNPEAIAAQERYISDLVEHTNPYTKLAYKDEPAIVGFEINNEPCHSGTKEEVKSYINRMLAAINKTGNRKPIFYNVSHNGYVVEAFYDTAIQGTTYQWYPIGLVSGQTQQGNFLPYVDRYDIPFANQVKGFDKKTRMIYEFDPADIMYSYMYPAMVRTFRTSGFQWITQFAYDPMDLAYANTEYQTHYLNLAYTPHKAISLKIAAEAAQKLKRGASYGVYPQDTLFGDGFRVSYSEDLSELNDGEKFYYSNSTHSKAKDSSKITSIAGCGSSPLVNYEGTGAYFIDRLEAGVWRLEVMPDAIVVNDPFAKTSLKKEVVTIAYGSWDMALHIPDLGSNFTINTLHSTAEITHQSDEKKESEVTDGVIHSLRPGVYLLKRKQVKVSQLWTADTKWKKIKLGEYAAPAPRAKEYKVMHKPVGIAEANQALTISAQISGPSLPDSVLIYTDKISFWNDHNPSIKMKHKRGYTYQATIPAAEVKEGYFRYNIIVCRGDNTCTFPGGNSDTGDSSGTKGNPLDWDFTFNPYWTTRVIAPGSAIQLVTITDTYSHLETYTLPEWNNIERSLIDSSAIEKPLLRFTFTPKGETPHYFLRTLVKDKIDERRKRIKECTTLCIRTNREKGLPQGVSAGFITSDGYTYKSLCPTPSTDGIIRIPLDRLRQTDTALLPVPYPTFLKQYFHPQLEIPFSSEKIEKFEISMPGDPKEVTEIELGDIWLE